MILDCENCQHGYVCCINFRVPLAEDEVGKYPYDKVLSRKGIYTLQKDDRGQCIFLDELTKKCRNWDDRPKACREYDCKDDIRVVRLHSPLDVPREVKFDNNIRVVVSVEVMNASDKRKVSPMLVQTQKGVLATEPVEVVGTPEEVTEMVQEHIAVIILDKVSDMEAVCSR